MRNALTLLALGLLLVAVLVVLVLFTTGPADWGPPPPETLHAPR